MMELNRKPAEKPFYLGHFITWLAKSATDDGRTLLLTSRRVRKSLSPLEVPSAEIDPLVEIMRIRHNWFRFWAPQRVGWWIAVLLMIGSALFAIGAVMGSWPEMPVIRLIDKKYAGGIFFVGSLFFTSAGYLQWLEVINGDVTGNGVEGSVRRRWLFYGWRPRNLGYLAAAAQLIGMIFFNINTADALITNLDRVGEDVLVWTPNMLGSMCFLIASHAAVMEVSHRYWTWQFRSLSWWITFINMLGSIFFMASAIGSFVEPDHVLFSPWLTDFGTLVGAVCFLVGGYLLIPEQFEQEKSSCDYSIQ